MEDFLGPDQASHRLSNLVKAVPGLSRQTRASPGSSRNPCIPKPCRLFQELQPLKPFQTSPRLPRLSPIPHKLHQTFLNLRGPCQASPVLSSLLRASHQASPIYPIPSLSRSPWASKRFPQASPVPPRLLHAHTGFVRPLNVCASFSRHHLQTFPGFQTTSGADNLICRRGVVCEFRVVPDFAGKCPIYRGLNS